MSKNPNKPSRQDILNEIAEFIGDNDLAQVYGCITSAVEGKYKGAVICYTATFCKARILDGEVKVYNDKKIEVTYQTGIRDLPRHGKHVFDSKERAIEFLQKAFVERDTEAALAIPEKPVRASRRNEGDGGVSP